MTKPIASSFGDAREDYQELQVVGVPRSPWSSDILSGTVTEYVSLNGHVHFPRGSVKETVVHFVSRTDDILTAQVVPELLRAMSPVSENPCHYIIDAEGYAHDFAATVANLAGPQATHTLIDRSIMQGWNEDRRALNRLAVAIHTLQDLPPSSMFWSEITADPRDVDEVSVQFGRALYLICFMAAAYHGDVDISGGVAQNWVETPNDFHPDGQVTMALTAIDIAIGAITVLFPELGVDPDLTKQTLVALGAARNAAASASEPETEDPAGPESGNAIIVR